AQTDALLEISAAPVKMREDGALYYDDMFSYHVAPFEGANIDPAALEFTGIDPYHPLRPSQPEAEALKDLYTRIRAAKKEADCKRAILVAHNATFDQGFLNAANERCNIKRNPFHPFSSFDTATLSGLALGQTVLAKACYAANIEFNNNDAHSAAYDTRKTAELFCYIVNRWKDLGGWPPPEPPAT
ncbi:MAG: ribonuclease T, partial [Gammaproteobacteria bacterium]|nr:ribonuclease T [Gammaproteobacteria bacterium]